MPKTGSSSTTFSPLSRLLSLKLLVPSYLTFTCQVFKGVGRPYNTLGVREGRSKEWREGPVSRRGNFGVSGPQTRSPEPLLTTFISWISLFPDRGTGLLYAGPVCPDSPKSRSSLLTHDPIAHSPRKVSRIPTDTLPTLPVSEDLSSRSPPSPVPDIGPYHPRRQEICATRTPSPNGANL